MRKFVSALALGAAMLFGTVAAEATIVVDFSITGSVSEPGTVTGHLEFANAGVGVAASAVYIDSAPSRFFLFANDNLVTALHTVDNSFTVTADGNVTSADMYIYGNAYIFGGDPAQASAGVTGDYFQLNYFGGNNSYEQDFAYPYPFGSSFSAVANTAGFGGATFTPAAAVPEPAAWTMLIGGFGLVGAALRRRRAKPIFIA